VELVDTPDLKSCVH